MLKCIFNIKDNGIYKARLVVRGFHKIKGIYYTYTYSLAKEVDSFRPKKKNVITSIYKQGFKTNRY
jgi:hypothetical protein